MTCKNCCIIWSMLKKVFIKTISTIGGAAIILFLVGGIKFLCEKYPIVKVVFIGTTLTFLLALIVLSVYVWFVEEIAKSKEDCV